MRDRERIDRSKEVEAHVNKIAKGVLLMRLNKGVKRLKRTHGVRERKISLKASIKCVHEMEL